MRSPFVATIVSSACRESGSGIKGSPTADRGRGEFAVCYGRTRRARAFTRGADGVAAVEFALLAFPLLVLICVLFEAGAVVFAQQSLELSLGQGARTLRTGAFQDGADGSDPLGRLRKVMCGRGYNFYNCDDLRMDVTSGKTFVASRVAEPYDEKEHRWSGYFGTRFECPSGGDVVAVRVAVPVMRPFGFLDTTGRQMPNDKQLLVATAIFRAENYQSRSCS